LVAAFPIFVAGRRRDGQPVTETIEPDGKALANAIRGQGDGGPAVLRRKWRVPELRLATGSPARLT
jgi:hypothetical protein